MPSADGIGKQEAELLVCLSLWGFCSVGMLVINKLAIIAFPLECTLLALQFAFTVLSLLIFCWRSLHIGSARDALRWAMVAPLFTSMLLTSLLALKNAPMSLVVTFRALSPLVALMIEPFFPNPVDLSKKAMASILVMLVGALLYASQTDHSSLTGIGWVLMNNIFAIADRLLQRLMLAQDQMPVNISKSAATLLNHAFGLLGVLAVIIVKKEYEQIPNAVAQLDATGACWVVASCVVGLGIGYTGVWAQSLITATSFLVLVNANKFLIIAIEFFFRSTFMRHEKALTLRQSVGACMTLLASVAYARARQRAETEKAEAQGDPLDNERIPIMKKP